MGLKPASHQVLTQIDTGHQPQPKKKGGKAGGGKSKGGKKQKDDPVVEK